VKQQHLNIRQLKKTTGDDLEGKVQKRVIEYLNLRGHVWGRVNTTGLYSKGIWRKNPQLFKGLPDILAFKKSDGMFDVRWWAYAIECKRADGKGKQSPHQKQFQKWWEGSHNIYVLARGIKDLQEAGL